MTWVTKIMLEVADMVYLLLLVLLSNKGTTMIEKNLPLSMTIKGEGEITRHLNRSPHTSLMDLTTELRHDERMTTIDRKLRPAVLTSQEGEISRPLFRTLQSIMMAPSDIYNPTRITNDHEALPDETETPLDSEINEPTTGHPIDPPTIQTAP